MKLLVISDSHGALGNVERVLELHKDADYVIHAGDGADDLEYLPGVWPTKIIVSGNNDIFSSKPYPFFERLKIENIRVAVTHGHRLDVSYGLSRAEYYMLENGIDLLIFGHTHEPYEHTLRVDDRLLYMFNPGSIRMGSYGLVNIVGDRLLMSHGKLK